MTSNLPKMMRAATQLAYGINKDTIVVQDMPVPTINPASNHVLIKVHAASIAAGDFRVARGDVKLVMSRKFPHVLGFDVSGTVVSVGSKCERIKVGDEVYGDIHDRGSMAQYAAAPEACLMVKPKNVSFEEAATLGVSAQTAYQVVKKCLNIRPGQKVLVLGGSGGVGSLLVQFAKALGATHVCATTTNTELVKGLGADRVINYKEEKWGEVLKGEEFDAVVDCVGGGWGEAQKVMKNKGSKFCAVAIDPEVHTVTLGFIVNMVASGIYHTVRNVVKSGPQYLSFMHDTKDMKSLVEMNDIIAEGKVKAVLDPTRQPYVLESESVLAMFEYIVSGRVKGKLVLKVL